MQLSTSWEYEIYTVNQEISSLLWHPKVHCRVQKSPPPIPILSQLNPVHNLPFRMAVIHFIIILQFMPGFLQIRELFATFSLSAYVCDGDILGCPHAVPDKCRISS
jgi:hypothetical protein